MKLKVKRVTEIEVTAIECSMAVRYDEEDIPNDFPLRKGDIWVGTVGETGIIRDWPIGKSGELSMKVCDEGSYTLLGKNNDIVAIKEGYVPSCIPGEYGDYVNFEINENGQILRWDRYFTKNHIAESFFGEEVD